MVTQRDVAEKAGVSFITVSRVINENGYVKKETREKVLRAIKELNYYPNHIGRALHIKSVHTVGIIIPTPADVTIHTTEYYNLLIAGIERSSLKHGYDLLFSSYRNEEPGRDYLRLYFQRKVDGLILVTPDLNDPQLKDIVQKNIPCVIIGDRPGDHRISYVDTDNFGGMCGVIQYLVRKGHRDIGFVKGDTGSRNARDRFDGYLHAMKQNGLTIRDNWVVDGNFTPESGKNALKKIISSDNLPSALICANDLMALGVLSEAKSARIKIPQDLALVGFDGIGMTAFTDPPLSTVIQPLFDMGLTASEMLFDKLKNPESPPVFKVFPVEFFERKSV